MRREKEEKSRSITDTAHHHTGEKNNLGKTTVTIAEARRRMRRRVRHAHGTKTTTPNELRAMVFLLSEERAHQQ